MSQGLCLIQFKHLRSNDKERREEREEKGEVKKEGRGEEREGRTKGEREKKVKILVLT